MKNQELSIYEQYRGTNIEDLILALQAVRKKIVNKCLESVIVEVFSLQTATGDALDLWGRRLGFSRFIPKPLENDGVWNDFNFASKNFVNLKFNDPTLVTYARLSDDQYRKILIFLAQSQNVPPTITELNKLAKSVFESAIKIKDNNNMSYQVYYNSRFVEPWIIDILSKYDIFPRPSCVKQNLFDVNWNIFGFFSPDPDWNRVISAFYNSQFLGDRKPPSPDDF